MLHELAETVAHHLRVHPSLEAVRTTEHWDDFFRDLQADFPTPEQSARKKLMADLRVWKRASQKFSMRYAESATTTVKSSTSRWVPRVFARVLFWLSALETCIERGTGPFKNETVQNAARRVLSRWYRWFDTDGLRYPVPRFEVGPAIEDAGGGGPDASLSVDGLCETALAGQDAKKLRTDAEVLPVVPLTDVMPVLPLTAGKDAHVGDLAASAWLPAGPWPDGMSVLHEGAGSPGAEDEMVDIRDVLPKLH